MIRRVAMALVVVAVALGVPAGVSAQLDPKAVLFTKPEDLKFVKNAAGTQETAVLFGDPTKEDTQLSVNKAKWIQKVMEGGALEDHEKIFLAIRGVGGDPATLTATLAGKTQAQINDIAKKFKEDFSQHSFLTVAGMVDPFEHRHAALDDRVEETLGKRGERRHPQPLIDRCLLYDCGA